jgi:hypothetical protein
VTGRALGSDKYEKHRAHVFVLHTSSVRVAAIRDGQPQAQYTNVNAANSSAKGETMFMEDLFGVAGSCDKFRVSLPGADAFSAFKGDYGCHYSIERPFKVFVGIRHGQCSSPSRAGSAGGR